MSTKQEKPTTSIRTLRILILAVLVVGVTVYTAVMFSVSQRLSNRLGPQVRADLEWRVQRGAHELANASELGLVLGDEKLLQKSFGLHMASPDVQAIVAMNTDGNVVALHGNPPERPAKLFTGEAGKLRTEDGYLVSWELSEIEGAPVGRVALVVSTARLAEATALLGQASNVTLLGGLAALFLGTLVVSFFTRAVALRDARLSDYAANLERKVEERTQKLDARNRGMRLVLDNVAQAFITVGVDGIMSSERSAICDVWFGAPEPGASLAGYLQQDAPEFASWFELGLEQLQDDLLPVEISLAQLPTRFSVRDRTFDVAYTPIVNDEQVDRLLVVISDVTEQIVLERTERDQRELVAVFQRILADRVSVEAFLAEADRLVEALQTERDPVVQRRLVHTIKGNCATYGLESVSELAHEVEVALVGSDGRLELDATKRSALLELWRSAARRIRSLMGASRRDTIEIQCDELRTAVAAARAGTSGSQLAGLLEEWRKDPAQRRLEELARQGASVARRLGKPEPRFAIHGNHVRLDSATWSSFWSAMVHAVRNAVDHGIEDAETRAAFGKLEVGTIELSVQRQAGKLNICVKDDGQGIDWEKVCVQAKQADLPCETRGDLIAALFADGITTQERATDVSGRGVGLAALRQAVRNLNGVIAVESERGCGTTFRFVFDERPSPASRVAVSVRAASGGV